MKILVAGGAGFIGTNLVKTLVEENHKVYVVDNLCTSEFSNIEDLVKNKKIKFFKHDISKKFPHRLSKIKFDQIYNLASPASPRYFVEIPIEVIETNVYGVHNLLKLALKCGATFLQSSTSEVYGSATISPQKEDYWGNVNPNGIRSPYDEGKRCAEALIYSYQRKYNLDVRVVRIFNTYGPYMKKDDGRVVSNFVLQAINNKNITIYGDGTSTRSFCFVNDLIRGIKLLMNTKSKLHGPINIGNDNEFTIQELAEKVIKLTKSSSIITYCDKLSDDPIQRKPDLDKAKTVLNYEPTIQLEEGLKKTIEYFKNI